MSARRRETDLSDPVCAWLRSHGYTVYCEVPIHGCTVDIVGRSGIDLVAVELKLSLTWRVIRQAMIAQNWCRRSFVAVGTRPHIGMKEHAIKRHGIGILSVMGGRVEVLREAEPHTRNMPASLMRRLDEIDPGGVAGLPGGTFAPAQDVADQIVEFRRANPGATWKEIYAGVPNHYASARSMVGAMKFAMVRAERRRTRSGADRPTGE